MTQTDDRKIVPLSPVVGRRSERIDEMNVIKVNDLFRIEDPRQYKFHAARWNRTEQPLDVFVRSREEWLGWNMWRNKRDEFNRRYIFSLIDFYHANNIWLFGGIYEVVGRGNIKNYSYEIAEIQEYNPYVGRLKVRLEKPSRGRAFLLEKHLGRMVVTEILQEPYSGEAFPGYEWIDHDFSELLTVFATERPDWKAALQNVKGVYLITDKSNGKRYVGSAYGDSGIWARWNCYIDTAHGWNDELTKLIGKKGREYALKNFRLSLLEYRPMKTDDSEITNRERFWKKMMLSRGKYGYNKN